MSEPARPSFRVRAAKRFEPIANALAGHRWLPLWAIINHRGRRSGTAYATPIAVVPAVDRGTILICLPYGLDTNWARNVVAAGGATLRWKGREQRATNPRILDARQSTVLAKPLYRFVVRRMPGAIALTQVD